jgi:hypothetical protein
VNKYIGMILFWGLLSSSSVAGVINLADQHRILYDKDQWVYVLSEQTFKRSLGLLELKTNDHIKGMIDTEVRFASSNNPPTAQQFLKEECQKLQAYWDQNEYDVKIESNQYCLVEQKNADEGPLVTQVIQARQSRSTPNMFFLHTWTFHTQKEHLNELRMHVKKLREMQQ